MLVYATHSGGRYLPISDSLKEQPSGKRNLYVNVTNHCNCSCTFCLRQKKHMAEQSTLWYKDGEPGLDEFKAALDAVPWEYFKEIVFCGFGEPTRLNTNGLGNLEYGEDITPKFDKVLDTISISLNASNAERYYELTRAKYGIQSYDGMLDFAQKAKRYVPNVVLTIVDHVEGPDEIAKCQKICDDRGLKLRVRPYEDH